MKSKRVRVRKKTMRSKIYKTKGGMNLFSRKSNKVTINDPTNTGSSRASETSARASDTGSARSESKGYNFIPFTYTKRFDTFPTRLFGYSNEYFDDPEKLKKYRRMVFNRHLSDNDQYTQKDLYDILNYQTQHGVKYTPKERRDLREMYDDNEEELHKLNEKDRVDSELRRKLFNGEIEFDVSEYLTEANRNKLARQSRYNDKIEDPLYANGLSRKPQYSTRDRRHVDKREIEWLLRDQILKAYKDSQKHVLPSSSKSGNLPSSSVPKSIKLTPSVTPSDPYVAIGDRKFKEGEMVAYFYSKKLPPKLYQVKGYNEKNETYTLASYNTDGTLNAELSNIKPSDGMFKVRTPISIRSYPNPYGTSHQVNWSSAKWIEPETLEKGDVVDFSIGEIYGNRWDRELKWYTGVVQGPEGRNHYKIRRQGKDVVIPIENIVYSHALPYERDSVYRKSYQSEYEPNNE